MNKNGVINQGYTVLTIVMFTQQNEDSASRSGQIPMSLPVAQYNEHSIILLTQPSDIEVVYDSGWLLNNHNWTKTVTLETRSETFANKLLIYSPLLLDIPKISKTMVRVFKRWDDTTSKDFC